MLEWFELAVCNFITSDDPLAKRAIECQSMRKVAVTPKRIRNTVFLKP